MAQNIIKIVVMLACVPVPWEEIRVMTVMIFYENIMLWVCETSMCVYTYYAYVCVHMYMLMCMYLYIYICICIHVRVNKKYAYRYIHTYMHMYENRYVKRIQNVCVSNSYCPCMYVRMCVCI